MAFLHTKLSAPDIDTDRVSASDKKTGAYIEQYGDVCYDSFMAQEGDWQVFCQLTELRKGILSWYDFPPESSLLEVGAGFGTLTGCLCGKCAHVTATDRSAYRARAISIRYAGKENLDIYAGDISEIVFPAKFDYIVIIGLLERAAGGSRDRKLYAEYLKSVQKWLKPGGTLLFAVENRFGLRYFCGEAEPHTGRPFDGLNHYMGGTRGRSFSRKELEDIVREAGFGYHKFYYPLPDYKLPQLIYTDAYLPEKNLRERLIPYYRSSGTLVAAERELYDEIVSNGVFPFFANSFLVECRLEETVRRREAASGQNDGILYAAVSTDRGESRSYATTIGADGIVCKRPLYEEGRGNARRLYENILDLQSHGIPVVRHRLLDGDALEMPRISWPTLSNYIKEIMPRDQERFLELIRRIYAYILQSSVQVAEEENLLPAALGLSLSEPEVRAVKGTFGPILKKAYMELIPLNCFYHPETGDFLYFDQEFVRENYPAKYVLFRAIHYIYCFTPDAERYCPKKRLLQIYGMESTWDFYLREETRFLDEVRNREQYSQFYRRTKVDGSRLLENIRRLESGRTE